MSDRSTPVGAAGPRGAFGESAQLVSESGSGSPARPPADHDARERTRTDLDSTLFVEAAAGSGKTAVLVDRIVESVRSARAELRQIAAITFTEAAASELRLRVRDALVTAVAAGGEALEIALVESALDQLDEAVITTIHGFCQRVLAEHPLEAHLPPGFSVLDETRSRVAWRDRWSTTLDLLVEEPDTRDLVAAMFLLALETPHLEAMARAIDDRWDLARPQATGGHQGSTSTGSALDRLRVLTLETRDAVVAALDRAIGCSSNCASPDDRLLARLLSFGPVIERLKGADSWRAQLDLLASWPGPSLKVGRLGNSKSWAPGPIAEVRALVADADDALTSGVAAICEVVLRAVAARLGLSSLDAADERRASGELGFHDLLVFARDLLRTSPAVRSSLRARFKIVLVDEFQDTDPLQLEIVQLVSGQEPGRAFFVGDPLQAIYRFRGADLGSYKEARRELTGDAPVRLTTSFRAVPGIVGFVNGCFSQLIANDFTPLEAYRAPIDGAGPPVRIAGEHLGRMRVDDVRREEATSIAAAILAATRPQGGWLVADRETGEPRPARPGDIAILVPRRRGVPIIEETLSAMGIAYRLESASLVFGSQEVRDLLSLCRAIGDPGDQAALVATVRAPIFACGDDDLLRWRAGGGCWDVGSTVPAGLSDSPVAAAFAVLRAAHDQRDSSGPLAALDAVVQDRRAFQIAASSKRCREALRALRYALEQARAFVEAGGGGLADFADFVAEQLEGNVRLVEASTPDEDEESVRILTMHGSKGLEFPIVIVAGLGRSRSGGHSGGVSATVLWSPDGVAEIKLSKDRLTSGFGALDEQERVELGEEEVRLLYVAVTRARDHLVVCVHRALRPRRPTSRTRPGKESEQAPGPESDGEGSSLADLLVKAASSIPDTWANFDQGHEERAVERSPIATVDVGSPLGAGRAVSSPLDYERWQEERAALVARAHEREQVAATEVGEMISGSATYARAGRAEARRSARTGPVPGVAIPGEEAALFAEDPFAERSRGRAGTKLGRAVHAVLQSLDVEAWLGARTPEVESALLAPIATAQARAERIAERSGEVERLVRAALLSPTVLAAFESGAARREVFVSVPIGRHLLEGFVDLCYDDGEGIVIVDYKTDTVTSNEQLERSYARYGHQAAAYALAISTATGRPVSRCVLVFIAAKGGAVEREVTALETLSSQVRALIETVP